MTGQPSHPRRSARALVALWALLQAGRLAAWPIVGDARSGSVSDAWLYPGIVDVVIGVSAVPVAYLLWRRRSPWVWLLALGWFLLSVFDHIAALAAALATPVPEAFFAGSKPAVIVSLVVGLAFDAAAMAALLGPALRHWYVGPVGPGAPAGRLVRAALVALSVWVVLQISRFIAVGVVADALADDGPKGWLSPAIGDLIVATASFFVAYALLRSTAAWVWVVAVLYLLGSIYDHLDTITVALHGGPIPETFSGFSFPAWLAPGTQTCIDLLFLAVLLLPAVRAHFFTLAPARGVAPSRTARVEPA